MTNTNNNNLPKFETIYELKENHYEIKTSKLSLAARAKVIRMHGGNYVSELGKEGYGPCIKNGELNYDNCHCSSEELDRQYKIIRNKRELEALEREKRMNEESKKKQEEETKKSSSKIPSDYIIIDGMVNPKYWFDPDWSPLSPFKKI